MPTVLIAPEAMQNPDGPYCRLLREAGFEVRFPQRFGLPRGLLSHEEMLEELDGVAGTIAGGEPYTAALMDALPELRVIARAGVGYDAVDVDAATERKIAVTITPHANHECVAELTLALMFSLAKRILVNDRDTRSGGWAREPLGAIRGKTLGIVGLGRIGRSLAKRAIAMGMRVVAFDVFPNPDQAREIGVEFMELDSLLGESDYVSLHCPLDESNRNLFNAETFGKMKPGSRLINMARGGLVVEADLLAALESGHLAGAGLDVFQQEPPDPQNPLFQRDDVVVSPHLGGADEISMVKMGVDGAQSIVDLHQGSWPADSVVNRVLKSSWSWSR